MQTVRTGTVSPGLKITLWSCAISPGLLFLTLVSFAIHIRIGLGHWPQPMWENYTTPLASAHESALVLALYFALFAAPVVWLATAIWGHVRTRSVSLQQVIIYLAGWGLIFAAGYLDPTSFTEWLLD